MLRWVLKRLSPEVDLALSTHVQADPRTVRTLEYFDECVRLLHPVAVEFNEAAIADLPAFRARLLLKEGRLGWLQVDQSTDNVASGASLVTIARERLGVID